MLSEIPPELPQVELQQMMTLPDRVPRSTLPKGSYIQVPPAVTSISVPHLLEPSAAMVGKRASMHACLLVTASNKHDLTRSDEEVPLSFIFHTKENGKTDEGVMSRKRR